jgi:hypothetical protein
MDHNGKKTKDTDRIFCLDVGNMAGFAAGRSEISNFIECETFL